MLQTKQPACGRGALDVVARVALAGIVALGGANGATAQRAQRGAAVELAKFVENRPPVRVERSSALRMPSLAKQSLAKPKRSLGKGASTTARIKPASIAMVAANAAIAVGATAAAAGTVSPPAALAETAATPAVTAKEADGPPMTMDAFLDRLMVAESGGRLDARNPRSTALGPFQFIESTFLGLVRRSFASETTGLTPQQILALRADMAFSRKAAEAYTKENAAVLQSYDVPASYPNLRLAFLLGPAGAARVLKAPPDAPLAGLMSPAVLVANPFMASLTARGLAQRSAREVAQPVTTTQGVAVPPGTVLAKRAFAPAVPVTCNLRLPSCKRWLALQTAKVRGTRKTAGRQLVQASGPVAVTSKGVSPIGSEQSAPTNRR